MKKLLDEIDDAMYILDEIPFERIQEECEDMGIDSELVQQVHKLESILIELSAEVKDRS